MLGGPGKVMEDFLKEIEKITEGFDENSAALIKKSYELACAAHKGQKRMSGHPYITHSIEVARILKEMRMDAATISAGLLHDVIEDSGFTVEDLKKTAGENVAFLVEGVSHVTAKVFKTRGQVFSESLKKMFLAMAKDIRVIIIKLADRLHNMRTIKYLPEDRQREISQETLNIYAPLAHRLGMAKVKSDIEDLAFAVLNPAAYREIAGYISEKKEERERRITEMKARIERELLKHNITIDITGRPKHFYSIYQKMMRENKRFEDIYDLFAIRIITAAVGDCYTVLGIIHNAWKPVPGRFKDYIAMPKSNMYQSLHTTVLEDRGSPVEIQIRTKAMDEIAEEGIAAHWNYKEDRKFDKETDPTFIWLRQLLEWQGSLRESEEFIKDLKLDLFDEEVFVFTPKGDVKELVKGSTILDFAYSVHSDLGDKCTGGKVNGKWVTIKYELKNGDMVEIEKGPNHHPTVDWMKIVKTPKAKNRIRHWLKTNSDAHENLARGRALLASALGHFNIKFEDVPEEAWAKILEIYNVKTKEDMLAGLGYGEFSELKVANHLKKAFQAKKDDAKSYDISGRVLKGEIIVDGKYSDIDYKFARCCNPVPGDEITGIFTKKGISIHRKNCANITLNKITAPVIGVSWNEQVDNFYMCKVRVFASGRDGLVNDLVNTVSENKAYLSSVNTNVVHDTQLAIELFVKIKGQKHLNELLLSLKKVKDVISVERQEV
jgi:GTP diphosphokinase / guanosine-3',5'-bis(diphosphate) 3'-diphosphatase